MTPLTTSVFDLGGHHAKADPSLIADDERHFAAITQTHTQSIASLTERLATLRRSPGGKGKQAIERDLEIHQTTRRLRSLQRFGLDLCLGRIVHADSTEPTYIGRLGLTDQAGRQLLVDWRTPAAEPFFAATHASPLGVASRRRYRWTQGRITDYWDEVLIGDGSDGGVALDDDSAFIASLGASRSPQMRDVLSTIAADQDAIIRAGSHGALVVDGGPGTGKTVVALHRAAYLLYDDPRLAGNRGRLLVVGPHEPYLAYIADVLPSLGEEGVATCTLRDLVPEGATVPDEPDAEVAELKSSARLVAAIERGVRWYEEPPTEEFTVETWWGDVRLTAAHWAEIFDAPEVGTPHNEARDAISEALEITVLNRLGNEDISPAELRKSLAQNEALHRMVNRAWPILDATDLVGDLWTVPAFLRLCAPWLDTEDVRRLQRADPSAWTSADLPLLDAARQRLGDAQASQRRRHRATVLATERERMDQVVHDLIDSNTYDDGEGLMSMLRQQDLRDNLVDETAAPDAEPDLLVGPFAHIIVDEAQELTDAEWGMLLRRCPSRSFTVVGDRAQARHGFTETWTERLDRIGLSDVTITSLTINYRTPEEVMVAAEPIIRAAIPDANVPTSIRGSGIPVTYGSTSELGAIVDEWLTSNEDGTACVIGDPTFGQLPRVRSLSPEHAKGLEFDLVVLVDPDRFGDGVVGAVDTYVAMTRATRQLVMLTS